MVILDVYGLINPQEISNKLGIFISNLPLDWKEGIDIVIKEELHNKEFDMIRFSEFTPQIEQYDLPSIINDDYFKNIFNKCTSNDEAFKEIAEKLICIQIDIFKETLLDLKNPEMCNPSCEKQFEEKFIKFMHFIARYNKKENDSIFYLPSYIYSSDNELFDKPKIIRALHSEIGSRWNKEYCTLTSKIKINDLKYFGSVIDKYLEKDQDIFKLDYLINSICEDNEYNAFHLFKSVSLIEMLLINPKSNGKSKGELELKLPQFLPKNRFESENEKVEFCSLIRVIRNKIAHGDFDALSNKLEDYASKFMKNFKFDYFEHSRENWIFLNLCCILDEAVSSIIWMELSNKTMLSEIKNS